MTCWFQDSNNSSHILFINIPVCNSLALCNSSIIHDVLVSRSQFQIILHTFTTCQSANVWLCVILATHMAHGPLLDPELLTRNILYRGKSISVSFSFISQAHQD